MSNEIKNNGVDNSEEMLGAINFDFVTKPIINTAPSAKGTSKTSGKKKEKEEVIMLDNTVPQTPMVYSNIPYMETYDETNVLLKTTIAQVDILSSEVKQDLDSIRASRTLKKKYDYIPNMANTMASLLNTKLNAIKEMNDSISKSHDLDLKRVKEVKAAEAANKQDDDKYIMDMYAAFINSPLSTNNPMGAPTATDLTLLNGTGMNAVPVMLNQGQGVDYGYQNYVNNMTPEQRAMRYENNPNIQTVVRYDRSTGVRQFDVVDMSTGQSVPGMPIPDSMFLKDITIDSRNSIARDTNLNKIYPLIMSGENVLNRY